MSCIADPNRIVTRPTWSPDGRVVFVIGRATNETQAELLRYATSKPNSANQADWTDQGYVTDSLHGQRANDFVYYAAYSRDGKQLAFTANWGKDFSHLYIAPIKDGVPGKAKEYVGVRGCDVSWRPDGLELAVVQRGDNCESDQGQITLIDPKKPAEQRSLRPGGSPSWASGPLGQK